MVEMSLARERLHRPRDRIKGAIIQTRTVLLLLLLTLAVTGCSTWQAIEQHSIQSQPACPNLHPHTPREHWCDPHYRSESR
jgi:hypothetical protein